MPPPTTNDVFHYWVSNSQHFVAPLCINKSKLKGLYKPKIHALNDVPTPKPNTSVYTSTLSIENLLPLLQSIQTRQERTTIGITRTGGEMYIRSPLRSPLRSPRNSNDSPNDICAVCGTNFDLQPRSPTPGFQCHCGYLRSDIRPITNSPYSTHSLNATNALAAHYPQGGMNVYAANGFPIVNLINQQHPPTPTNPFITTEMVENLWREDARLQALHDARMEGRIDKEKKHKERKENIKTNLEKFSLTKHCKPLHSIILFFVYTILEIFN